MSHTTRLQHLRTIGGTTRRLAAVLASFEAATTDDALGATMSSGGGPGPVNGKSDKVGEAATTRNAGRDAERRLEKLLRAAEHNLADAEALAEFWTVELPARAEELAEAARNAEPGCEIAARVGGWEEVHRTTDLGGLLERPYALSQWAARFARRHGRLPREDETRMHLAGHRVTVPA